MAKRYVLVKSDGEGPKPCAFFSSAAGCRNGAGCKFLHGDQPTAGSLAAKSQPPPPTKTKPATAAVATPPQTPVALVAPPVADKEAEAERAAKKKAKKKAKKEKAAREAAEAAAAAAAAHTAVAPAPTPTPAPVVAAPAAPVATPVVPAAPSPSAALVPAPLAPVAASVNQTLSKTQAKKQAFREKAARKAEAAAAAAAAAAANAAAVAAAAATNPPPVAATAAAPAAPATVSGAGTATPVAAAANGGLPVSKKKKRKNKKKPAQAAVEAAVPSQTPAAPTTTPPLAPPATTGPPPAVFHPMPPMSTPPQPVAAKAAKPVTRVCSFFNKKKGCQVGALCPFLHQGIEKGGFGGTRGRGQPPPEAPPVPTAAAVVPPPASLVPVAAAPAPAPTPAAATMLSGLRFAVPPQPIPAQAATPAVTAPAPVGEAGLGENSSARRTRKRGRSETPATAPAAAAPAAAAAASVAGILDGLPISPFVMPDASAATATKEEPPAEAVAAAPVGIPHPKADVWQVLVDRTRAHPKFAKDYSFETDATWITASPCGESCAGLPQVVAVDCEMCMSEDPLSKERNGKELLRMSIVRGEDGEKLMDTLVRPNNPVVDWRTDIHGVAAQHLEGVMFTHRHAQVAISRICCQHTVIIGHALNNDLTALKMNHGRVVDTSFLFEGIDKRFSTPSLKDVVKEVLKKDIQNGSHDSVKDAQHTLEAARYALGNTGAPLPGISRSKRSGRRRTEDVSSPHQNKKRRGLEDTDGADARAERAEKEERSLMVHRLPAGTTQDQLLKVMQKKTKVIALGADPIDFSAAGTGKTQVVYATKSQADIAFNGIPSNAQEDTSGRLQKKIFTSLDGKKYIAVRHALIMSDDAEEETGLGLTDVFSSSEASSSSEGE